MFAKQNISAVHGCVSDKRFWRMNLVVAIGYGIPFFSVHMNRKAPANSKRNIETEELEKTNANLRAEIVRYKQTEQSLRRSEAYLAEAERLCHTGSWAYDVATGVPVYWSLERCRISRFDPAKGHPTLEEYRQLHAAEDWEKLMEAFKHAIRNKIDFETDAREILMDGFWYCSSAMRVFFSNKGSLLPQTCKIGIPAFASGWRFSNNGRRLMACH